MTPTLVTIVRPKPGPFWSQLLLALLVIFFRGWLIMVLAPTAFDYHPGLFQSVAIGMLAVALTSHNGYLSWTERPR